MKQVSYRIASADGETTWPVSGWCVTLTAEDGRKVDMGLRRIEMGKLSGTWTLDHIGTGLSAGRIGANTRSALVRVVEAKGPVFPAKVLSAARNWPVINPGFN